MDEPYEAALAGAAERLSAFAAGPASAAAEAVGRAFDRTGQRMASALGEAARSGELSVKALAATILRELSAIAIEQAVTAPLRGLMAGLAGGLTGGSAPAGASPGAALASWLLPRGAGAIHGATQGARASGGPVVAGGRYLVGERGPELFTPSSTGAVTPSTQPGNAGALPPVTVHIHLPAGAPLSEARRASGLVAASLARAVQRGSALL